MKVAELIKHLKSYVAQDPKHKDVMVMIKCNEGEAFSIGTGENNDAMGIGMSVERFLVLGPDTSGNGTRLELNKKVN